MIYLSSFKLSDKKVKNPNLYPYNVFCRKDMADLYVSDGQSELTEIRSNDGKRPLKVDIQNGKVDIESVLSYKGAEFSLKTTVHIHDLFGKFGFAEIFGRGAVMELLGIKSSGASKLLSNLVQADIIEPVAGHGKGKYKFKKE